MVLAYLNPEISIIFAAGVLVCMILSRTGVRKLPVKWAR